MKMLLSLRGWKSKWISGDENVSGFHGMKMWLNFMECKRDCIMGWKCNWSSWDENVTEFHGMNPLSAVGWMTYLVHLVRLDYSGL